MQISFRWIFRWISTITLRVNDILSSNFQNVTFQNVNFQDVISGVNVSDTTLLCKSDHYCITFNIKSKFKTLKIPKRELYNYKRANWAAINPSLNFIEY